MTIPEAQLTVDVLRGQRAAYPEAYEALSSAITFMEGWIATQDVIERAKAIAPQLDPFVERLVTMHTQHFKLPMT